MLDDAISGWNDWVKVFNAVEDEWKDMNICELHGFISALVTICEAPTADEWQLVCENAFITELPEQLLNLVTEEAEDIHEQLKDTDDAYEFQPLLPDDTHDLVERVAAIVSWSNGFLTGYGITSTTPRKDEEELLLSLQNVARFKFTYDDLAEIEADDEEEQAKAEVEAQVEELLEFIRIVPVSLSSMGSFKTVRKLPIIAGLSHEQYEQNLQKNAKVHAGSTKYPS